MSPIYLDNNSTTRCDPRVVDAMLPYFTEDYGNAASVTHQLGNRASMAVEHARKEIAALVGGAARNILLTSGATEANNIALLGVMRKFEEGSHLITTAAEHKAVLDPAKRLETEGFEVTILPVDQFGMVSPKQVADAIKPVTKLVSIIAANNEVGSINSLQEIGVVCKENNVLLHTDATQIVGKLPFNAKSLGVDLASFSAHKLYGPKGVGALFVRRGMPRIKLEPIIFGGGHEKGARSGTLPVPLIVGFGKACSLSDAEEVNDSEKIKDLRDQLVSKLTSSIEGVQVNGHPDDRIPGNANLSFEGINSEALLVQLNEHVALSTGSACTTADPEPSHVLIAMGMNKAQIRSTVRFGIGRFNTQEEILDVGEMVASAVSQLRMINAS